jgi:hypothetical protein
MKTHAALIPVIVLLLSSSVLATQAPDVRFVVKYDGGTLPLAHETIDFHVVNDAVVLMQDGKRFAVPIAQITQVAYGRVSSSGQGQAGIFWAAQKSPANGEIVLVVENADYGRFVEILQKLLERASLSKIDQSAYLALCRVPDYAE